MPWQQRSQGHANELRNRIFSFEQLFFNATAFKQNIFVNKWILYLNFISYNFYMG
jgi:hypothetical protein